LFSGLAAIPLIIGRGGSTIKKLQQESGATFDLDRALGRVRIHGKREAVAAAAVMLDELLSDHSGGAEVAVTPKQIPLVIG